MPAEILEHLSHAGMIDRKEGLLRSKVRVSSIGERLFLHSAYPTEAEDSVFLLSLTHFRRCRRRLSPTPA